MTKRQIVTALMALAALLPSAAQTGGTPIEELQTQMYKLFYTEDSLNFYEVVDALKHEAQMAGNEQVFYKAWGNNAIYESTHQRRNHALEMAKEMREYAREHKSDFGQYTAIHVMGSVYNQMRDFDNAEKAFLEAADYLHKHSPGESAAADYIELLLVSVNGRSNLQQGMKYAQMALDEPGVSDQHRLRVLSMLCQLEGSRAEPDRELFNRYYEQRQQVREHTPADSPERGINVIYNMLNGHYDEALALTDGLNPEMRAFERSRIYHRMGQDGKAYEQMYLARQLKDSINRAERTGLLSDYITQLSTERLEAEKLELEAQNRRLRTIFILTIAGIIIALLVYFSWQRIRQVRRLRVSNAQLGRAHQEEKEARIAEQEARIAEHEARKEAEKELDVKREFLNNIAQELRSPLNPITGFTDILADQNIELQPEEREMMSQHIKENSKLLTGIIDHMIELSFYESKSSLPKDDVFSPNVLCQNAIDFCRMHQLQEGVEIDFRTELEDTRTIRSDFQGVDKVIRQLLGNAAKFTATGGILLYLQEDKEQRLLRFIVTDTGLGIDPEHAKHIFEPTIQTGENVKSTGMGLAICARITKLLGARIAYDETYRQGSRFVFELPEEEVKSEE